MDCPACKNEQLVMSERKGVEIDYCPKCRGIWLDRGELDKIIDRANSEGGGSVQPTSPQHHPQQPAMQQPHPSMYDSDFGKYKYKKRKHWLLEILD